jgi:16S rRNA (guanine(966)-N(2))-methyltransferase RsmD
MRVIAGQYRSRPLRSLRGMDTRPTSDRLRETLFNVLAGGNPESLAGTRWLDLFAGTGAVGIEALSRGVANVVFVESSPAAVKLIRENLASLGITGGFEVVQADVLRALGRVAPDPVDFVFLDPPYRVAKAYESTLEALSRAPAVTEASIIIAEHDKKFDPGEVVDELLRFRKLVQGDAALSFYRRQDVTAP